MRSKLIKLDFSDDEGWVTIPGFYDGVELSADVKEILSAVPDDELDIQQRAGFAEPEKVGENNQHSPNENLRLGNYFEGIETIHSILKTPIIN